jgi:hypothetical protein
VGHSVRVADGLIAVEACPALITLAALALRPGVLFEAVSEVVSAGRGLIEVLVGDWVKEFVSLLLLAAGRRIQVELERVRAAGPLGALDLRHTAARKVHSSVVGVVHYLVERILATVLVDGPRVSHAPVKGLTAVKHLKHAVGVLVLVAQLLTPTLGVREVTGDAPLVPGQAVVAHDTALERTRPLRLPLDGEGLGRNVCAVRGHLLALLLAGEGAAVTVIELAVSFVVVRIALSVAPPEGDALLHDTTLTDSVHDIGERLTLVVAVVDERGWRHLLVGEDLGVWPPSVPVGLHEAAMLQADEHDQSDQRRQVDAESVLKN